MCQQYIVSNVNTIWREKQNKENVAVACVENHQNEADNTVYWNKNERNLLTGNIPLFVVVSFTFCYVCIRATWRQVVCDETPASKLSTSSTEFLHKTVQHSLDTSHFCQTLHYTRYVHALLPLFYFYRSIIRLSIHEAEEAE